MEDHSGITPPVLFGPDPADDGMEVTIIRAITGRTDEWYRLSCCLTRALVHLEDIKTRFAEEEFCRRANRR